MQDPTVAELLELILMSESSIDIQAQFWITVTFATIVASYAARESLSNKLRALVSTLYLIATVVFASRWYYEVLDILIYEEMLRELGYENNTPILTGISRIALMLVGTVSTIYFIYFGKRESDDT